MSKKNQAPNRIAAITGGHTGPVPDLGRGGRRAGRADNESTTGTASSLMDQAGEVAATVGQSAQDAAMAAEEMLSKAGSAVGSSVGSGSRYLVESGRNLATGIAGFLGRHPVPTVLISLGVGYLAARITNKDER